MKKAASEEDPRFTAVVAAFAADRALAPIAAEYAARKKTGGRKFGSNGLKVNGNADAKASAPFAFVGSAGRLVVKLPKTRVAELAAARKGEPFDPGHGRVMKEWLCVTSARLSWLELAREAYDFVKGAR